ncbi:TIGR03826 family flagellar region protein [Oceanobacillus sp. HCA-5259]|uniref:TIGR03826 family flagellar region protein n=1 Tax=Oceanobacillus sp. HCA-5259 TaxID=3134661 RepID=UPI0030C33725
MAELANCSRCGAVYVMTIRDICQDCYKKEEEAFQTVYHFLREKKNREATMIEIVEATGVEEKMIMKFVKERRLLPTDFPNLAYPCDRCGRGITTGKLCENCQKELKSELAILEEEERTKQEREERERENVYFSFKKDKN